MHSKSDSIEIMINHNADEVIEERFKSLHNRYKNNSEKSMKASGFVFNYVHLFHYKCHKTNLNLGGLYIDSLQCIMVRPSLSVHPFVQLLHIFYILLTT